MLVLASASPRRRELLSQAGFTFQIHPANIPEDPLPNEDPIAYVTRLALQKAQAVYRQLAGTPAIIPSNPALYQGSTSVEPISSTKSTSGFSPCKTSTRTSLSNCPFSAACLVVP